MISTDESYVNHKIFEELNYYAGFYESLSFSVMSFATQGTTAVINMDTYVFMSMKGTLEAINLILKNGNLNDAYALLRKYYDSVMINAYTNLYIHQNFGKDNLYVTKVNNWLHGETPLPRIAKISNYLDKAESLTELNKLIYSDSRYEQIRERCNDNMHYNFFSLLLLNDGRVHIKERIQYLEQLRQDIENIFILNMAYILMINDHYMMSSDYMDYLECNIQPPENSQYWVAEFIQNMADKILSKERPDILALIKQSTQMQVF